MKVELVGCNERVCGNGGSQLVSLGRRGLDTGISAPCARRACAIGSVRFGGGCYWAFGC